VLRSIEKSRKELAIYNQVCEDACLALPCNKLAYEDVAYGGDRAALLDGLQRWLGVPPKKLRARTVKMNSNYSRSIPNFAVVESAVTARYGADSEEVRLLHATHS
jgi:hypothetical protein